MPNPSSASVLAWTRLVRAHNAARGVVECALKAEGLPGLEWYDVLLELERVGPSRPRDLQARLLLAQYNLSRLLDRMVEAGVVERKICETDRRGQLVDATEAGKRLRQRMWPVYAAAIEASIGKILSVSEAETLAAWLGRIVEGECPKPESETAACGPA